jgi:hypothetical protein
VCAKAESSGYPRSDPDYRRRIERRPGKRYAQ